MIIHSVYCILFQETTVHALFPFVAMISHGHAIGTTSFDPVIMPDESEIDLYCFAHASS